MVSSKFTFFFGLWTTVLLVIVNGGAHMLDNVVPEAWIPYVLGWSGFMGAINSAILTALAGYADRSAGPLTKAP